nr:SH3 domain-containing kinase-binding protein 1 isoform X8 [Crassostrea gigas]
MVDVLVEFDYDAEQEDELTIKVGDIIRNVQMSEGGWWEGELNGKKGMFPDNFVKVIEKKKEEPKKELLVTQQRSSVRELANKLKDVHVGAAPQKRKEHHHHHHHSEKKKKAKVLFDYEPENEDELKIEVGDTVEIIKQEEEGWWEGVLNGKTGVFPSNFVEMIGTEDEEPNNDLSESQPAEEKPETKGKKVMGIGLGNIFEGGPIKLRSTAASAKRPVEKQDPKPIVTEEPVVLKREKPAAVEKAVVRYSYSADNEDELSLKENEIIVILDKELEDAGWWKGELNGKVGVFPDNFVELIPAEEGIDKFSRPLASNKIPPQPKPKKPPPPSALPNQQKSKPLEKEKSLDQKHPPVTDHITEKLHKKKEPEPEPVKTGPPLLPGKKPVLPPPVGKKPSKPDPPKPVLDGKPHFVGLRSSEELPSQKDKDIPQAESHFDGMEPTSERLVHLTASRAKGPAKRPPSQVILNNKPNKRFVKEEERNGDVELPTPKHPAPVKEIAEEPPVLLPAKEKHQNLPARPPEPSVASSGLLAMVEELKREIRELKTNSVSKAAYNELKVENDKLRQDFESFKTSCGRKIRDLVNEVDEEKKIRLSTEVEMKRIKKMVNDESHV